MDRWNREKLASSQPAPDMPGSLRMPPAMSSAISSPGNMTRKAVISGVGPATDILSRRTGRRLSRLNSDSRNCAWSPDGTQIVTADDRVWETATGKQVGNVGPGCEPPLSFSPDGKRLAAAKQVHGLEMSRLCVWNFETKSLAVSAPSARASVKFGSAPTAHAVDRHVR